MKKITLLVFSVLLSVFNATAQHIKNFDNPKAKAEHYLDYKGEVCFHFKAQNKAQIQEISKFLPIGHAHIDPQELIVEAYANKNTFPLFLNYGLPYTVKTEDNELTFDAHKSASADNGRVRAAWDTTWDAYPTYPQYVAKMQYYANTYPNLCTLENFGNTQNGRELLVLKISDNITTNEAEPEFFYTSSMHGNEIVGFPLMMRLIDYLLTNYGSDQEVTDLVNSTQIFINPLGNPDGAYQPGNNINTITAPTRANSSNQDLNRNYPDNIRGLHYDGTYQNETLAFMAFEKQHNFVLSANLHGGTELVNYPFDNVPNPATDQHPDHDWYERISVEYATNCQNSSPNGYMVDDEDANIYPSPGVTQGSAWYTVFGGRQDYMNYYRKSREVTIELSDVKFVNGSNIPNHWNYNRQAFLDYMKQADYGLQGIITDQSGNPVKAKVYIAGHDQGLYVNSWVSSNADLGDYYRLLNAGTYNVTFEAPGYVSQTISVNISNNQKTVQNVTLIADTATPTAADTTVCSDETSNLTVSSTATGELRWYDAIDAETPIATGSSYTTPMLTTTTTYYVEDFVNVAEVGDTRNNSNGGFLGGERFLTFNCTDFTILKQVTINANQAGEIEVELRDSGDNVIDADIFVLDNGGIQTLDLNFMIPAGNGLKLVTKGLSSGLQLYRNNSGTNYPYTNGNITITDSNAGTGYYYHYYNWVTEDIKSARIPVTVTVEEPTANFNALVNTENNGEVAFNNTSTNATSYSWDFGDGTGTSTDANPTYSYASTGDYTVTLTSNSANCSEQISYQVSVTVNTLSTEDNNSDIFSVYPNPFNNEITISPNTTSKLQLTIYDISGRVLQTLNTTGKTVVNMQHISSGTYFIKIEDTLNNTSSIKKIVKR